MRSREELSRLGMMLLGRLYKQTTPPLDFKKFLKDIKEGKTKCPERWYMQHTITRKKYDDTISKFKKQYKITELEWRGFQWLLLDYSPAFKPE